MRQDTLSDALASICAAFGRTAPSGVIRESVWSKVNHIPDEAVGWIVEQICDESKIPDNIGKAISQGWYAWQRANPQRLAKTRCESGCDSGWRHCWRQGERGRWVYFVAPCPVCQKREERILSPKELEASGAVVMPTGYSGGPLAFDRDKGYGALWPAGLEAGEPSRAREIARQRPDMRPDSQRLRHLPEREMGDAVGWGG